MKKLLNNILYITLNFIKTILELAQKSVNKLLNIITRAENYVNNQHIDIYNVITSQNLRMKTFYLSNISLLEGENLFREIYNSIFSNEEFINFGSNKIIILFATTPTSTFSLHQNVLVNNNTTYLTYYELIKDKINYIWETDEYEVDVFTLFEMHVWNIDHLNNKNIKVTSSALNKRMFSTSARSNISLNNNTIKPISEDKHETTGKPLASLDLETININGVQECICISFYNKELGSKLFLINYELLVINPVLAFSNLWEEFFKFLEEIPTLVIFVHNLGSFDGYFIYKQLSLYVHNSETLKNSSLSCLLDKQNKFISIKYKRITFKDSYRVFPVSLENLCKITNTKGKISKYNPLYNDIGFFKDEVLFKSFIDYSTQDSKALFHSLIKLQIIYIEKYKVDITTIFSTSTLSLKIFRTNFQKEIIPVLTMKEDRFIRKSYFGGATDYYKAYGKNLYYYDVTSLYPFAMCKPLPGRILKFHENLSNTNLDSFFGFIECEITIDSNILKPMVPFKHKGKTIFPTGNISGVYFSEELKAISKIPGYKINLISGCEYTKVHYFNSYIEDFFNQKKTSKGAERFIAKMHLNQLYGYFGRSYDIINTININSSELKKLLTCKLLKTFIGLTPNLYIALVEGNVPGKIIKSLNLGASYKIKNNFSSVNTNVSIASAITSYARIEMMQYKLNYDVFYSDTDLHSIVQLFSHLINYLKN
jgi:DNA polymerase type B, organellar and viral